jgi:hypothetical protein
MREMCAVMIWRGVLWWTLLPDGAHRLSRHGGAPYEVLYCMN